MIEVNGSEWPGFQQTTDVDVTRGVALQAIRAVARSLPVGAAR